MASRALPSQNLYEILELPQTASRSEIRAAYHRLAKQSHPDKNPGADPAVFHALQQAYETLSDSNRRAEYDASLQPSLSHASFTHPFPHGGPMFQNLFASMFRDDLSDEMFGPSLFSASRHSFHHPWPQASQTSKWHSSDHIKSPDLVMEFDCTLEDLMNGKTVRSEIPRQLGCQACNATGFHPNASLRPCRRCAGQGFQSSTHTTFGSISYTQSTCTACEGSGSRMSSDSCCPQCRGSCIVTDTKTVEWSITRGMLPDEMITLPSMGNALPGHSPGDVTISLSLVPHSSFKMVSPQSRHLLLPVTITLSESLLGLDRVIFQHLDGRDIRIHLPAPHQPGHSVIKPGDMKVIKGMGLPGKTNFDQAGDLWIKFKVEWPTTDWIKNQNYVLLQSVLPPGRPDITSPQAEDSPQEYANLQSAPLDKGIAKAADFL